MKSGQTREQGLEENKLKWMEKGDYWFWGTTVVMEISVTVHYPRVSLHLFVWMSIPVCLCCLCVYMFLYLSIMETIILPEGSIQDIDKAAELKK